jgi:hypothetical protein
LYDDNKLDHNDIAPLDKINVDMSDSYAKGKISEQHYNLLNKKIESSEITSDNKTKQDN